MAHAELEHAGEGGLRGRAHHKALEDAEFGMGLPDAHHLQDRLAGHEAVRVEGDHEFVILPPAQAEIAQVARLETLVAGAAAIEKAGRVGTRPCAPGGEGGLLLRAHGVLVGVAEHIIAEQRALAGGVDAGFHGLQPGEGAGRVFVSHGHEDGGAFDDGLVQVAVAGEGGHAFHGVLLPQQPEPQKGVPHPQHAPGGGDGEAGEDEHIHHAPPARAQNLGEPGQQQHIGRARHEG